MKHIRRTFLASAVGFTALMLAFDAAAVRRQQQQLPKLDVANGLEIRCSFHAIIRENELGEVDLCSSLKEPGCQGSCTGLSKEDDALNPNLAANDLIVRSNGREVATSLAQRRALFSAYRQDLLEDGVAYPALIDAKVANSKQDASIDARPGNGPASSN